MKLHFDPNQQYQLNAVKSIVDIFEGQPLSQGDYEFGITEGSLQFNENGVGNNIILSEEQILTNLQEVQKNNGIAPVSEALAGMNFTVEMETGTGKTELTRSTIFAILKASRRMDDILVNPQMFLDHAVREIRHALDELMIDGIKYEKIGGQEYKMELFRDDGLEIYEDKLAFRVNDDGKTIYSNYIPLDSGVEEDFAKECETREDVEFYFKLPLWFKIKTPIGNYNPDWALIFRDEKKIYFVAETKSTTDMEKLRPEEKMRIKCGKAHFREFDEVEYRHVESVGDLM
ncbi:MAG: hypothetical protein RQ824_07795 [bacterium]|nr:hypothetical protein [bacterium]